MAAKFVSDRKQAREENSFGKCAVIILLIFIFHFLFLIQCIGGEVSLPIEYYIFARNLTMKID
jgi:hypothetical protein